MTALTQITNTAIFTFIAVLLFKKIANVTGKLLQNYKELECEICRILFKHAMDSLSVFFQFVLVHDCKGTMTVPLNCF